MLFLYFNLVLFLSMGPSSGSEPIRDLARPPLWEFLCSAMLAEGVEGFLGGVRGPWCVVRVVIGSIRRFPSFFKEVSHPMNDSG